MRLERALPLSLMAVSLALVASIGMSVAWYANGAYLRTSNVDVALMSDPTLGLSLTESNNLEDYHYGEFPYDELPKMKSGYSDAEDGTYDSIINGFVPVSSMFSKDWIGQVDSEGKQLEPQFCTNYKRASLYEVDTYRKTKIATAGFYSVPLYLICDHDMYVSFQAEGTTFKPNVDANEITAASLHEKDPSTSVKQYTENLNGIIKSLRFSVYDCETSNYWIIDPTKEETTYLAGTLDLDANKSYDFYADSTSGEYKEYLFGEYDDSFDVVYTDVPLADKVDEYDAFRANHAEGVKTVDLDYYKENNLIKAEESYRPSELENRDLIALKNRVPHRIVLSIYIEGWDRDNTSVSSLGSFFAAFKFKVTTPNFSN